MTPNRIHPSFLFVIVFCVPVSLQIDLVTSPVISNGFFFYKNAFLNVKLINKEVTVPTGCKDR